MSRPLDKIDQEAAIMSHEDQVCLMYRIFGRLVIKQSKAEQPFRRVRTLWEAEDWIRKEIHQGLLDSVCEEMDEMGIPGDKEVIP